MAHEFSPMTWKDLVDWSSVLGLLTSLGGLGISVWVAFSVRKLRRILSARVRLPELAGDLSRFAELLRIEASKADDPSSSLAKLAGLLAGANVLEIADAGLKRELDAVNTLVRDARDSRSRPRPRLVAVAARVDGLAAMITATLKNRELEQ